MFLEKGSGKVFEVFNQRVVWFRPVHGEVKTVFIALCGVGKVTGIGAVRNDKQLQILKQGIFAVKTLFTVTMYLVESLTNRHAALFQFDLYQW